MLLVMQGSGGTVKKRYEYAGLSREPQTCPECEQVLRSEYSLGVHFNDDHGFDWLTICNKMPVSDEA